MTSIGQQPDGTLPDSRHEMASARETRAIAKIGLALAIVTGIVFTLLPALDPAISSLFLDNGGGFALAGSSFWKGVRWMFLRAFAIWYIVIVVAGLLAMRADAPVLSLTWPKWLFMAICSLLGPFLLTNVWLKEEWGRWRPREVSEFGGSHEYTGPLNPTGGCLDNCSFVSGEVSSAVMLFLSLAMVSGRWRYPLYWLTAFFGGLSALVRVGQGGHFMSDTLFAAAFMLLVAAGTYRLMFLGPSPLASQSGVDVGRIASINDRLFQRLSDWGLAILDRVAPRR